MYLLTYDKPHRKTQDLVFRLGKSIDITLALIPWVERKNYKPLFNTKLPPAPVNPEDYGLSTCTVSDIPKGSIVAIGGAGILESDFVNNNTVINVHCGYLPAVRGLDALKWAIYYDERIGCITHIVDEKCDAGLLIDRQEIELDITDSLFSIAMKQYELEINMMVECLQNGTWKYAKEFNEPKYNLTRRMNHKTEIQMMKRLEQRLI